MGDQLNITVPPELSEQDAALWLRAYTEALAQTQDAELADMAGWGAVRKARVLLWRGGKSAAGNPIIRGWAMLFTDEDSPDVDNTFFDDATRTLLDFYPRAPLWMNHGEDPVYGIDPIGQRTNARVYPRGIVLEHELFSDHPQFSQTTQRIERGELVYSTDTMPRYAIQGFDPDRGYLGVWFAAGCSLTDNPAEPALGAVTFSDAVSEVIEMKRAAKAREAQGGTSKHSTTPMIVSEGETMNELVSKLALFLGVSDTVADVKSAMEAMAGQMETPVAEGEAPAPDMPDFSALRAALGLPESADAPAIAAKLRELIATLEPSGASANPTPTGKSARTFNYAALRDAEEMAAKSAPGQGRSGMPHQVPDGKSGRNNVNVNKGAPKPGVLSFVNDILSGKAQSTQTGATGGYILNNEVSNELLPELLEKTWLTEAGVQTYPMDGQASLTIPKVAAGATASWVGEGQEVDDSEMSFDTITLVPKIVAARIIVPNQFLKNTRVNYEAQIRKDIQYRIKRAIEQAALFGTGGVVAGSNGAQPRGLINVTGVNVANLATNGAVPTLEDLTGMELALQEDEVEVSDTWRWVFSPRSKKTFTDMTDTTGNPLLRPSWAVGSADTLIGYPYQSTVLVPNNRTVGSSTDCSLLILGDWQFMALGISNQLEITVNPYRLMHQLQTEIIAYTFADVAVLYPEAFEIRDGARA